MKVVIGEQMMKECYPFRFVLFLEDALTVHGEVMHILPDEKNSISSFKEQRLIFILVEEDDLPVCSS